MTGSRKTRAVPSASGVLAPARRWRVADPSGMRDAPVAVVGTC